MEDAKFAIVFVGCRGRGVEEFSCSKKAVCSSKKAVCGRSGEDQRLQTVAPLFQMPWGTVCVCVCAPVSVRECTVVLFYHTCLLFLHRWVGGSVMVV